MQSARTRHQSGAVRWATLQRTYNIQAIGRLFVLVEKLVARLVVEQVNSRGLRVEGRTSSHGAASPIVDDIRPESGDCETELAWPSSWSM